MYKLALAHKLSSHVIFSLRYTFSLFGQVYFGLQGQEAKSFCRLPTANDPE